MKEKKAYVCTQCGADSPKWLGRCPACGEWNTMKEISVRPPRQHAAESALSQAYAGQPRAPRGPIALSDVQAADDERLDLRDAELNRVLGGGLVKGSLTLLGGEPGIGKSTLLLQTVLRLSDKRVLYVSGEESERQIKLRADRMPAAGSDCLLCCETDLGQVFAHAGRLHPDLLIVDSIQTMALGTIDATPGTVTQIRECTTALLKYAKESGVPVVLIGHITKEGVIAGPKVLEHIVDTVLQFEGDRHHLYRLLRSQKNRFGATSELGIYEMRSDGLHPVENPSGLLLSDTREPLSGIAIASAVEGIRPLLIETQALVSTAAYGTPQRSSTGFDLRRLNMLLAVLEKRVGFRLAQKDVFLNIAGGLRVTDPAIDLSVIAGILSSNVDTPIERGTCMTGEVGLSGEIRPVARIDSRIAEACKLGFKRILLPADNLASLPERLRRHIETVPVRRVEEALRELFG